MQTASPLGRGQLEAERASSTPWICISNGTVAKKSPPLKATGKIVCHTAHRLPETT